MAHRLSLLSMSRSYCLLQHLGFLLQWLLLWSMGSIAHGHSSCGTVAPEPMSFRSCSAKDLAALQHVESSRTRDGTDVPALAGRFLTTGLPGKS